VIQANCPNCGDTVPFHSEFSTHAVCASCDSLVVRQGANVELLGKVAEIQQDGSPLQLGVQGQYQGRTFQIVGRIQLAYQDGFWNEWHLYYSNGESGWLGEAMGEYFINFAKEPSQPLPTQHQLGLGDKVDLDGEAFVVSGVTLNRLSAYEGEIPFVVDPNQQFTAFDLRSASGRAATIDFADNPPTLYLGEYKTFQELQFTGTRQEGEPPAPGSGVRVPAQSGEVDKFNCPTCGAPHSVEGGVRSKTLVCEYCGSAVDISNSSLNVIWQEEKIRTELQGGSEIPLKTVGQIVGLDYKVIGYVKKSVTYQGIKYPWIEYLLYNHTNGYRWLVDADGHYTLMETLPDLPTNSMGVPVGRPGSQSVRYEGKEFKHFQSSTAVVEAVAGEFYWRVKVGEQATNFDYVCPPETLSMEASQQSFVWSKGVYKTHDEIRAIFGLQKPLKAAVGVGPAQPNPHTDENKVCWRVFNLVALVGLVLLVTGVLSGSGKKVFETKGESYTNTKPYPPKTSKPFKISGHGNVAFDFMARPKDRWAFIKANLKNTETKKVYSAGATLEQFYDKRKYTDTVRVGGVPPGTYTLTWEVASGTKSKTAEKPGAPGVKAANFVYSITLYRGVRVWGWYMLMIVFLLPIPFLVMARRSRFETRRWSNSDYG